MTRRQQRTTVKVDENLPTILNTSSNLLTNPTAVLKPKNLASGTLRTAKAAVSALANVTVGNVGSKQERGIKRQALADVSGYIDNNSNNVINKKLAPQPDQIKQPTVTSSSINISIDPTHAVSRMKLASSETKPKRENSNPLGKKTSSRSRTSSATNGIPRSNIPRSNSSRLDIHHEVIENDIPKEALAAAAIAANELSSEAALDGPYSRNSSQSEDLAHQQSDKYATDHRLEVEVVDGNEDEDEEVDQEDWLQLTPVRLAEAQSTMQRVNATFQEDHDYSDTTMLAEYSDEILTYMGELEASTMPKPDYMSFQTEIEWDMRATLIDWLMQLHLRYHLLPETLWIAVNILDRFLSVRIVSLVKLQLVGVTAMFIAAKYEEILAPSVEEFVYMTDHGFSREEILKGERIMLQTLSYDISPYCNPFTWVRRISKADDYDLQTRTLCKFIIEATLLNPKFLRVKPSLIAAVGMYLSRKMLGGTWDDAFRYYSGHAEVELELAAQYIMDSISEPDFEKLFVYKKYSVKRFLRASTFARDWTKVQRKQ